MTRISRHGTLNADLDLSYTNELRLGSLGYAGATEAMGYDGDGLLTKAGAFAITRDSQNGLATTVSAAGFRLDRTFNGHGEADTVEASAGGSRYGYSLDRGADGRIVSRTETVAGTSTTLTYTYDPLGRLRAVTRGGTVVEEYRYDANGNRTFQMNKDLGIAGRLFTHSIEDHALTAGPIAFEFDHDDRLAARTEGSQTTEYAYATTGELLGVRLPDGTELSYTHDPLGRRIAKAVNGAIVERYLWSGPTTLLAVYDGSNRLVQRFRYADGRMPFAMDMGAATYYLHYDQVGSLRLITDSSGAVVKRIDYDSFGTILADSNPAFTVPFGFAGGLHDRDTHLVRFGARDYMPEIGKWTAKDPIGFDGGDSNLFGYVSGDPVNAIDPLGLFNPSKGVSSAGNAINAGRLYATGTLKLLAAGGMIGTGVATPAGVGTAALGTWNLTSAEKAWDRSVQQWNEALGQNWSDATWRNLLGMLPYGSEFDDPCEPTAWEFLKRKQKNLKTSLANYFEFPQ